MELLLASADVYLTNMRPKSLEAIGMAPEQVHARHPKLVVTSITGYGLDGDEAWRPGYDIGAFWARTGIARDLAPRDAAPPAVRGGLGDHTTGITAVSGTMAALLQRTRTGRGALLRRHCCVLACGRSVTRWSRKRRLVVWSQLGRESELPRRSSTAITALTGTGFGSSG